jgi:hypothetical protein
VPVNFVKLVTSDLWLSLQNVELKITELVFNVSIADACTYVQQTSDLSPFLNHFNTKYWTLRRCCGYKSGPVLPVAWYAVLEKRSGTLGRMRKEWCKTVCRGRKKRRATDAYE